MSIRKLIYRVLAAALVTPCAVAGAWGTGSFDNDDALDWISQLDRAVDASVLTTALSAIRPSSDYIEAPQCAVALAAAELVAASQGRPAKSFPDEAGAWLKHIRPSMSGTLVQSAREAVSICRDNQNSELRQLWAESGDFQAWLADTASLLSRVGGRSSQSSPERSR